MELGLGVIEGFYGAPWSKQARLALLPFLAEHGYRFLLYAPKADRHLRAEWRTRHPDNGTLRRLGEACHEAGLTWGVGLSPLGLHHDLAAGRRDLARRATELAEAGVDHLALLFDDMHADVPDLARTQADIVAAAADASGIASLVMCPSYYSDAPILDRLFGQRPERYLRDLGRHLDEAVRVFWTGPEVCSRDYPVAHLDRVGSELGRRPLLWDNYPVNDGPKMCKKLHLRAFAGRGPDVAARVSGIAVNPMNQAWLSRLVLWTLPHRIAGNDAPDLTETAFRGLLPDDLAAQLLADLPAFMDGGLDTLEDALDRAEAYARWDHPAAIEVRDWLQGRTIVGPECLTDV